MAMVASQQQVTISTNTSSWITINHLAYLWKNIADSSPYIRITRQKDREVDTLFNWKTDWNKFCLEVNATRGEIYFYMNNEKLFNHTQFNVTTIPYLTSISIEGISLLSQASIFSIGAEDIVSGSEGAIVPWNISLWGSFKYRFHNIPSEKVALTTLILPPNSEKFKAAVHTCNKFGNGEVVEIKDNEDQTQLWELYNQYQVIGWNNEILYPYTRNGVQENFTNFYSQAPIENLTFLGSDLSKDCVVCGFVDHRCSAVSSQSSNKWNYFCNFKSALKLRGFATKFQDFYFYPVNKFKNFFWTNAIGDILIIYDFDVEIWILRTSKLSRWATSNASFGMT